MPATLVTFEVRTAEGNSIRFRDLEEAIVIASNIARRNGIVAAVFECRNGVKKGIASYRPV